MKQKKAGAEIVRRRQVLALIVFVLLMLLLSSELLYPAYRQRKAQEHEMYLLRREITEVQSENDSLRREADLLKQNEYLEDIARTEHGFVKPGEEAYILVPNADDSMMAEGLSEDESRSSLWQRLQSSLDQMFW